MKHDSFSPFGREVMKEDERFSDFESVNLTEEEDKHWTREQTQKAMVVKAKTRKLGKDSTKEVLV
jgi:hypothetical protein